MTSTEGASMFRCPKTGEEFDSGFRFAPDEKTSIPVGYKINLRCKICMQLHELLLADGRIGGGKSQML